MNQIPVLKPKLPQASQLLSYLEMIDTNRWYTNWGPLTQSFEKRLAQHFNVSADQVVSVSNGTTALTATLLASSIKNKMYCIVPSWSFVATAAAVELAGLIPVFVDVDSSTWALNPSLVKLELVKLEIKSEDIHSIIPVSPFGFPLNTNEWLEFQKDTGINVLFDAAASFDSFNNSNNFTPSNIPTMISLHATKVFGIGEGAVIICNDQDLILEIRKRINFGFYGSRESTVIGMNAKLSEYASAVGLVELDNWQVKRSLWQKCTHLYQRHEKNLKQAGIRFSPGYGENWISSYANIVFEQKELKEVARKCLSEAGIDTRAWWGNGIHEHLPYKNAKRTELTNTISLASRTLGLPFYTDLDEKEINLIVKLLINLRN